MTLFAYYLDRMTTDVWIYHFHFLLEYTYYETLGTQQPSLQCQISCCLVTHPSDVPAPVYDWNDVAVSSAQRKKSVFVGKDVERRRVFSNFKCFSFSSSLGLRSSLMCPWVTLCRMNCLISAQSYHHRETAKVSRLNTSHEQFSDSFCLSSLKQFNLLRS